MTSTRALLVLAAACSRTTADGPIALDDLESAYDRTLCVSMARCGLVDDVPLCVSLHPSRGYYDNLFSDLQVQAARAGKLDYDPAAAGACLAGFFSTCLRDLYAQPRGRPAECDRIFVASGGSNDPCGANEECISGYCLLLGPCDQNNCCQGECTGDPPPPPRPTVGQSCAQNSSCIESYCYSPAMICTPYRQYGASCDSTPQCEPGMRCDNGVCLNLAGTGDPCTSDADCQYAGDFCNGMTCQHYGLGGATCHGPNECGIYDRCDTTSLTCVLGARAGDPCDPGAFCIDESRCDPNAMRCVALLPDGGACTSSFDCVGGSCVFGVCQTPIACF